MTPEMQDILRRLRDLENGHIPANVLRLGNGDASEDRRIEFVTGSDVNTDSTSSHLRPGIVYAVSTGKVSVSQDGVTSGQIIGAGDINGDAIPVFGGIVPFRVKSSAEVPLLNAATVGNFTAHDLLLFENHVGTLTVPLGFTWTNRSNYQLREVSSTYGSGVSLLDSLSLPGTDLLGFTPSLAQLIIRYTTGASPAATTYSIRVRDKTTGATLGEITGIAVGGTNLLANAVTTTTWPIDATMDCAIEVKHSTGASGTVITIHNLLLVAR